MIVKRLKRNFPRYPVTTPVVLERYRKVSAVVALPEGWPCRRARFEGGTGLGRDDGGVPLEGGDGEGRHQPLVVPVIRRELSWGRSQWGQKITLKIIMYPVFSFKYEWHKRSVPCCTQGFRSQVSQCTGENSLLLAHNQETFIKGQIAIKCLVSVPSRKKLKEIRLCTVQLFLGSVKYIKTRTSHKEELLDFKHSTFYSLPDWTVF